MKSNQSKPPTSAVSKTTRDSTNNTAKTIIRCIDSLPQKFTRQDLIDRLTDKKGHPSHKTGQPRKGGRRLKTSSEVDATLHCLAGLGILEKRGKFFQRKGLSLTGTVRVNSTGNAVCVTTQGDTVIIPRDNARDIQNGDTVEVRIVGIRQGLPIGDVTKVTGIGRETVIAKITGRIGQRAVCTAMDDPKRSEMVLGPEDGARQTGSYVIVKISESDGKRESSVVEEFSMDNEEMDFRRIKIKHSLPEAHSEHDELGSLNDSIPGGEIAFRTDMRKRLTVTIDGADAKDFDDALSLEKNGNRFVLFVHIADVSHYVRKDGEIDREAYARGTSYYLGENVIPMLPEILSNGLCSLREGLERLSMTVEMHFDGRGALKEHRFHKSVIKVDHRLTYDSAEGILGSSSRTAVKTLLKNLLELASLLKVRRLREGRLDLSLSDAKLVIENHRISEIKFAERLRSHMIVEECMLSANVVVSRALKESGVPTLYRIHEDMEYDSLVKIQKFLQTLRIKLPMKGKSGVNLQKVIESVAGKEYEQVVSLVILKSMMQAFYGPEPIGHYGLAFPDYTHFTSPIRRYPDLVVHRCLKNLMEGKPYPYAPGSLAAIGEKSSEMERIAQKAERDFIKLKTCRLMAGRIGEEFHCVISGVMRSGFFVTLVERPVEGMVPLRNLTDDYYLVMEDDFTVVGKRHGRRFRLGDTVNAYLDRVDMDELRIDFSLHKPGGGERRRA